VGLARTARWVVPLLLATACRTLPAPVPLAPDDARPARFVQAQRERGADRYALRGVAQLAVDGEDLRVRTTQAVVLERPARLRVEVRGFLSQTAAVLATDGEAYQLFFPSERAYEEGPVPPGLLWQVTRIPLEPAEVVDLLLGAPLLDPGLRVTGAVQTGDHIRVVLSDGRGGLRQRVSFDREGRVRQVEFHRGGELRWTASYDDYAEVDGVDFAHSVSADFPGLGTHAALSLRDVEINPELPADVFRLRVPGFASALRRGGG
jgi:hypothetical protein